MTSFFYYSVVISTVLCLAIFIMLFTNSYLRRIPVLKSFFLSMSVDSLHHCEMNPVQRNPETAGASRSYLLGADSSTHVCDFETTVMDGHIVI